MKVLTTEQQTELQEIFEELSTLDMGLSVGGLNDQFRYWALEMKPKRVRKQKEENVI